MPRKVMDYRARGSWIGNVRGRLGKAGYGGSDVACILVCIDLFRGAWQLVLIFDNRRYPKREKACGWQEKK